MSHLRASGSIRRSGPITIPAPPTGITPFGTSPAPVPGPAIPPEVAIPPELMMAPSLPVAYDPSVIKVYVTIQEPNYSTPWQTLPVYQATGSGVVIDDQLILTAAHVVADATFVQVQRTGASDPEKYVAYVYALCHDSDLALLKAEKSEFYEGIRPMQIGDMPALRDRVHVAGFPIGGEELSITEGVVSRIEGQEYAHSFRTLLAITVDAAINSGNSGGPVFSEDGRVLGIAFQSLSAVAENTGHVIPPPVVRHFVEGVKRFGVGGYSGIPSLGLRGQKLTNPQLRGHVGMDVKASGATSGGILVSRVFYGNSCDGLVFPGDILTEVDGATVAANGTVPLHAHAQHVRVEFWLLATLRQCGDTLPLKVRRGSGIVDVNVVLKPPQPLVPMRHLAAVPAGIGLRCPPFLVYCGLVFQVCSIEFLIKVFPAGVAVPPKSLSYVAETGVPSATRREVVVVTKVLSDVINVGYEELVNGIVGEVNGTAVKDLADIVQLLEVNKPEKLIINLEQHLTIVLPGPKAPEAIEANQRIKERYRIVHDRSTHFQHPSTVAEVAPETAAAATRA